MINYNRINKIGYDEGFSDALKDFLNKKKRKVEKINKTNKTNILSKVYDIGYSNGYNQFVKIIKKIK